MLTVLYCFCSNFGRKKNVKESIDLILFAIDYNISNKENISSPFDLKIDRELIERIVKMIDSSVYKKVIWRD